MCYTRSFVSYFSWILSGYQFLPFWKKLRMRGVTLKYGYYEVKPNILKRAIPRILLFSQYFSFSLISARTFFLLALSFFLSLSQSPCRVLWQYENAIEYARDSFFFSLFPRSRVASALANLNALTNGKMLEIKGNKRI